MNELKQLGESAPSIISSSDSDVERTPPENSLSSLASAFGDASTLHSLLTADSPLTFNEESDAIEADGDILSFLRGSSLLSKTSSFSAVS